MIYRQWFCDHEATQPGPLTTPIVLLHEGLGSVSAWGRFPYQLSAATGRRVMAYDRPGYGRSEPNPGPWPAHFMHDEAKRLDTILDQEALSEVILVGHSDGASISLLHPSQNPFQSARVKAIVSLAAHVMVETISVDQITQVTATYSTELRDRLFRHHNDVDAVFSSWSDVWRSNRFASWSIDSELAAVTCPVLGIQGAADRYGSPLQLERLKAAVTGPAETHLLDRVDHWPHREATDRVLELITEFLAPI